MGGGSLPPHVLTIESSKTKKGRVNPMGGGIITSTWEGEGKKRGKGGGQSGQKGRERASKIHKALYLPYLARGGAQTMDQRGEKEPVWEL